MGIKTPVLSLAGHRSDGGGLERCVQVLHSASSPADADKCDTLEHIDPFGPHGK